MALTLREEITLAIEVGLSGATATHTVVRDDATDIYASHSRDPIAVLRDDVTVPDSWPDGFAAGIRLDVQAILAMDQANMR